METSSEIPQVKQFQNVQAVRNLGFGIFGIVNNCVAFILLLVNKKMQSPLKIYILGLVFNDMLFMMVLCLLGTIDWTGRSDHPFCWVTSWVLLSGLVASYAIITELSLHNFVAVLYPLKVKVWVTTKKSLLVIVSTFVLSWCLSLSLQSFKLTIGEACLPYALVPRYSLYGFSSICLGLSVITLILNGRTVWEIRLLNKVGVMLNKSQTLTNSISNKSLGHTLLRRKSALEPRNPICSSQMNTSGQNSIPTISQQIYSRNSRISFSSTSWVTPGDIQFSAPNMCESVESTNRPHRTSTRINPRVPSPTSAPRTNSVNLGNRQYFDEMSQSTSDDVARKSIFSKDRSNSGQKDSHTHRPMALLQNGAPPRWTIESIDGGAPDLPEESLPHLSTMTVSTESKNMRTLCTIDSPDSRASDLPEATFPRVSATLSTGCQARRTLCSNFGKRDSYTYRPKAPLQNGTSSSWTIGSTEGRAPNLPECPEAPFSRTNTTLPTGSQNRRSFRRTSITLIILTLWCCLITLPFLVYSLMLASAEGPRSEFIQGPFGTFSSTMIMVNALCNPFLYAWRFVNWRYVWNKIRKFLSRGHGV